MYWLARRGGTPWAKLGGALPRKEEEHKIIFFNLHIGSDFLIN